MDIYRRLYKATTVEAADEIRLELVDRFGASVEEVDNLFKISNLRVLASMAGFQKVELTKRSLRLHFPSEGEREFYEGGAFHTVMEKAGELRSHKLQLKQEGRRLLLHTTLISEAGPDRILEAQELLNRLNVQRTANANIHLHQST